MNEPNEQITTVQWDTRLNTIAVIGAWATLLLLILFGTTNSAQAQIELDVSGNIGIGTASPNATYRLRVSGDNAYRSEERRVGKEGRDGRWREQARRDGDG